MMISSETARKIQIESDEYNRKATTDVTTLVILFPSNLFNISWSHHINGQSKNFLTDVDVGGREST